MRVLDRIDRKILEQLRMNARISATDLARAVHLSRPAVQDRIRRLETDGLILGSRLIAHVHSAMVIFLSGATEVRRKPSGFQGSPTKPGAKMTPPVGFIREAQPDHKQQLE
ncbi:Lrp/AsnC family transcriptional regulator [Coralliovum pocilloporae]|uniref:Lrp/AsnC family transcriptional regulator n=1 Tax=Coralliovum pocilloporae TaxID=3066369 RepID=UPI0033079F57